MIEQLKNTDYKETLAPSLRRESTKNGDRIFRMRRGNAERVSHVISPISRNQVKKQLPQSFLSSLKENGKTIDPKYIIEPQSSINIGNKAPKLKFNPTEKFIRKGINKVIDVFQGILNYGKKLFFDPPINAQLNTAHLATRNPIVNNYEYSKKTGGLTLPVSTRIFTTGSYLGASLDRINPFGKQFHQARQWLKKPIKSRWEKMFAGKKSKNLEKAHKTINKFTPLIDPITLPHLEDKYPGRKKAA
jgi:hypothetical protein